MSSSRVGAAGAAMMVVPCCGSNPRYQMVSTGGEEIHQANAVLLDLVSLG